MNRKNQNTINFLQALLTDLLCEICPFSRTMEFCPCDKLLENAIYAIREFDELNLEAEEDDEDQYTPDFCWETIDPDDLDL